MSVGVRVLEASKALYARATEKSLLPAALAIDTTARRRYPRQRSNRDRYTRFVRENLRLITTVWFDHAADTCRIRARHPDLNPGGGGPGYALEDLLYYVMRSEIIREKGTSPGLVAVARGIEHLECGGDDGQVLRVSHRLIEGCLAAVVLAPENAELRTPEPAPLYIRRKRYWINRLWGRREYFCREILHLDLRDPADRGETPVTATLEPGHP